MSFDTAALDALPQTRFRTTTLWHKEATEFSGVSARDLFSAVNLRANRLRLVALNDYVVDADADELVEGDGLFATRQDGVLMPVSDKGPIFLLFPFDEREELRHQTYYSRAVWQLCEVVAAS
ncbi:hypothetical protein [Aureimonas sp. AU4]|uniref:hypothetical protein n=1 Tax=Aureimonas sp. AU4 TaxID=1638163 RepID=UPI00078413E6|nr:hypothetical protein [Aureimonas sp. AU4]